MITDRTQEDVDYAIAHPEDNTDLKGAYNNSDLNRVENKVDELRNLLESYCYHVNIEEVKTDWLKTDIFNETDEIRYLNNLRILRQSFYVIQSTPQVPTNMRNFNYQEANDIEKILDDINYLLNSMTSTFRYVNDVYTGEGYFS